MPDVKFEPGCAPARWNGSHAMIDVESPFDTIPGVVADALASEMLESPVPCELVWHQDEGRSGPAAYLAHFRCERCTRTKDYLLCEECRRDVLHEAVICAECGKPQPGWDCFLYFLPIGGPL